MQCCVKRWESGNALEQVFGNFLASQTSSQQARCNFFVSTNKRWYIFGHGIFIPKTTKMGGCFLLLCSVHVVQFISLAFVFHLASDRLVCQNLNPISCSSYTYQIQGRLNEGQVKVQRTRQSPLSQTAPGRRKIIVR